MPTAVTTTATSTPQTLSLKARSSSPSADSTSATLRSLYPRAARAFLQRNVALTHSLLSSAFSIIHPPASPALDAISPHRRKWDILRVTFETTLYASPPPARDLDAFPAPLRANLMLSPESFLATVHTRSLRLFTPSMPSQKPSSAFLPAQILVTLSLASLKLECTHVGRGIIEDWLARHSLEQEPDNAQGYAKVLELYCLHVLPRLEEWDYAEDFLQYERQLPAETRKYMLTSLQNLRTQTVTHRASSPLDAPSPTISTPSRTTSPALSTTSSTSSSSTSTHTATPRTPRPGRLAALTPTTPLTSSTSSQSIASATTSRTVTPTSARHPRSRSRNRIKAKRHEHAAHPWGTASPARVESLALTHSHRSSEHELVSRSQSAFALVRASLGALLAPPHAKLTAFVVFCVALPVLSYFFRKRRAKVPTVAGMGAAQEVRRRLRAAEGKGVLGVLWEEVVRAVGDTVRMGGRGLV